MTPSTRTAPVHLSPTAPLLFVQPTTLCNLDCSYCYLPGRTRARLMSFEVAEAVAEGVGAWAEHHPVDVLWHGGEPLTTGTGRFEELLRRFPAARRFPVRHAVQTNGVLIDDAWCELFARRNIRVSVSVDGPAGRNGSRVDRAGRDSAGRALAGISALRTRGVPFTAVAVVRAPSAARARELYDWFASLGCASLGVNLVERKGIQRADETSAHDRVVEFWAALVDRAESDGRLRVRDVDDALGFVRAQLEGTAEARADRPHDPVPMVMWNGDVVPFGPELAGFSSPAHGRFAASNVLGAGLAQAVARAAGLPWVAEAMRGVAACRAACDHFSYCRGGSPANKYFETGRFDGTETRYCRNSRKALMEGVLHHVGQR
ncbi:cyclophane-forming radical SAM peptide maturase AmcB [Streptomyces sp. NPDC000070]|uniref:cyclophane-forming radical SAM peptide maturase AmcB n=1 Tax=Streptomyces sp. NPDC000070 TaxID=3154240 RepID=UPI00331D8ABA